MKRIIAIVCTLALAITSLAFMPATSKADDTWIKCTKTTTSPETSASTADYTHWRFKKNDNNGAMEYCWINQSADPNDLSKVKFRKTYNATGDDGKPLDLSWAWNTAEIWKYGEDADHPLENNAVYSGSITIHSSMATETGCVLAVNVFGTSVETPLVAGDNTINFSDATYINDDVTHPEYKKIVFNIIQLSKYCEITVTDIQMQKEADPFNKATQNVDFVPKKDGVSSPWTLRANYDGSSQYGNLLYKFDNNLDASTLPALLIKTAGSVGQQETDAQGNPVDSAHRWWWVSGTLKNYASKAGLIPFTSYTGTIVLNTDKATDTNCKLFVYVDGKEFPFSLTAGTNTLEIPEFMFMGSEAGAYDVKFLFDELPKDSIISVSSVDFEATSSGGWTTVPNADDEFMEGPWNMFGNFDPEHEGNWGVLQYKANTENPSKYSDYSMKVASASGWLAWSVFARLENYCADYLDPGDPFDLTIRLNSSKATVPKPEDPQALDQLLVIVGNESFYFDLDEGENTLNIHSDGYTVGTGSNYHEQIMLEMDGLQAGTEITVEDIQITGPNEGWTNVPDTTDYEVGDWTLFAWNDTTHWSKLAYRSNGTYQGIGAYDIKVRRTTSNGAFTNMATTATLEDYLTTVKTTHGKSLHDGDSYDVNATITASSVNDSISGFGKIRVIINGTSFDFPLKKGRNTYDLTNILGSEWTYDASKDNDILFELDEVTQKAILNISDIQFIDDDGGSEEVPNATAFNPEGTPWTLYAETNATYDRYGKLNYQINGNPSEVSSLTMILKSVSGWHGAMALRATLRNVLNGLTKNKEYRLTMNVHIDESNVKAADKQVTYDKQLRIYIGDTPHDRDVSTTGVGTETFVETFTYNGTDKHIGLGFDQMLKGTKIYVESFTIEPTDVPTSSVAPTSTAVPTSSVVPTTTEEQSSEEPSTSVVPSSSEAPTSTEAPTTVAPTTTHESSSEVTTGVVPESSSDVTSSQVETATVKAPGKAKIKKIYKKKKSAKKIKIKLKKVKGAVGYQVAVYKSKKTAKKNKKALVKKYTKKLTITIKSKKIKNKKKLFVRARAYVLDMSNKRLFGKWSAIKKAKIKK